MIHENQISQKTKEEWLEEGIFLWKAKRYKEALEACMNASKLDSNCSRAYHRMGLIHTQEKQYRKAFAAYERASLLNPDNAKITFDLGELYFIVKDYERAYVHYKKAIKLDSKYLQSYQDRIRNLVDKVWLANQNNFLGDNDKAVTITFRNVLLLDPKNAQALSFFSKLKENNTKSTRVVPYERPPGRLPLENGGEYIENSGGLHTFNCRCVHCWEP